MKLSELKKVVFEHRPVLAKIIGEHGGKTLAEYMALSRNNQSTSPRAAELLNVFEEELALIFGSAVAEAARLELDKNYFVSTADHHGPICHPFFLNGNLLRGIYCRQQRFKSLIVLSTANISMNNSSYPRGLIFHEQRHIKHLPFFSWREKNKTVYAMPGYTQQHFQNFSVKAGYKGKKFLSFLRRIYGSDFDKNYLQQITLSNFKLWQELPLQAGINLIYLPQEILVRALLRKHHLASVNQTEISKLIFDPGTRRAYAKYFDGISGAFSSASGRGTFLFWGIFKQQHVQLFEQAGQLVSAGGAFMVPLDPESISAALAENKIIPGMALSFIVLAFYYGLKCGGGFSQVDYLSKMKSAYILMSQGLGRRAENLPESDYFSGEFGLNLGAGYQMTAIDLLLGDAQKISAALQKNYQSLSLAESLDIMMPEIYKIVTSEDHG